MGSRSCLQPRSSQAKSHLRPLPPQTAHQRLPRRDIGARLLPTEERAALLMGKGDKMKALGL
jgi:hypothetical protein